LDENKAGTKKGRKKEKKNKKKKKKEKKKKGVGTSPHLYIVKRNRPTLTF
jgi:hypothetical protein